MEELRRGRKEKKATSKQLHKSMALEKRASGGNVTRGKKKHKRTSKEDRRLELTSQILQNI